jgi:predicted AlkP superfamily pyrophosphatase or phosphodiesterase
VTSPAQASAETGARPDAHGVVANGWLHRTTDEIRFWLQSHALIGGETIHDAARSRATERGVPYTSARLFWWFNQGAPVDWSVTPKPHYGSSGAKVFGVHGRPPELAPDLERALGPFPFHTFWGPGAGLNSTEWIAEAAAHVLRTHRPTFTQVYLPHLDYDLQRYGPEAPETSARVAELDAAAGRVLDAAEETDTEVVAFSEYGILPVHRVVRPNRILRREGLLQVRDGPFGETIDVYESDVVAVCDHQVAHVYVRNETQRARAIEVLANVDGVAEALEGEALQEAGLAHARAGDLVLLAERDAWFAYPYWLDERRAPDFARTVDIHRKPGYDPLELFVDPRLWFPRLRMARRLLQKKLGFRYRFDVVPLDPSLVKGSHGVPPEDPADGPVLIAQDPAATERVRSLLDLKDHALERMGLS